MESDVLERLIAVAEEAGSDVPPKETSPVTQASPTAASPLAAVLGHPEVMALLPKLLTFARGEGVSLPASEQKGEMLPNRHTALLCAVKPYLGRERQQTADQLIGLCRLWDSLQSSGLIQMLPSLWGSNGGGGTASGEGSEV